ncbi:GAF domain-containing protein [Blastococcus sp. CT_GayMR20]|uniref:GAF domain-containing protein n=1 Tax=Blastococcus sp. CT_GayMR20 TaxID=2559609 RepID=UPI001FD739E8|nr:GAF domain-containing protein [Blastococcus sp. CT_GayMR20]
MTIAGRFEAALDDVHEPDLAGPELLPVRLSRACARMLRVDGAGLSLLDASQQRIPLGASSVEAEIAERLQFTVGAGPCMAAADTRQPVFAVEEDLRRRWPVFSDLLFGATRYRAVVALPLQPALTGFGALDLFFERADDVPELDVFEALAVGELVTSALSDAAVWSSWSAADGPDWLHGPAPLRRAAVWEAMGKLGVDLEIGAPAALALLRSRAYGSGQSVDDVAADLLSGRLRAADLTGAPDSAD